MYKYKLTYFNIEGLAEKLRLALKIGKIDFEDDRIDFHDWEDMKQNTPFGQLPILSVYNNEGYRTNVAQSSAILRYIGKKCGLYSDNDFEALKIDELICLQEDISSKIGVSMYIGMKPETYGYEKDISDDEKKLIQKKLREKLISDDGDLHKLLLIVDSKLNNYDFLLGNSPNIADCAFLPLFRQLRSGRLDYIPITLLDNYPNICNFEKNMMKLDAVKLHYS